MELTKEQMKMSKGLAILMMVILHLFCRTDISQYYDVSLWFNGNPVVYYIALLGGACVPIYCFCSGYGLFFGFNRKSRGEYLKGNVRRVLLFLARFWLVLILTAILYAVVFQEFSIISFLLSASLLKIGYCGAWWFVQTYALLVICSPFIFKMVQKINPILLCGVSAAIYFISYLQRIKNIISIDDPVLSAAVNAVVLFGTSQFSFILGAVFCKYQLYSKIDCFLPRSWMRNILCLAAFIICLAVHAIVQSMIIDPGIGILLFLAFNLYEKKKWQQKMWLFWGRHSTNIWLVHMLFYATFLPDVVFWSRNVFIIFITLIALCLAASYVIDFLYSAIEKLPLFQTPGKKA